MSTYIPQGYPLWIAWAYPDRSTTAIYYDRVIGWSVSENIDGTPFGINHDAVPVLTQNPSVVDTTRRVKVGRNPCAVAFGEDRESARQSIRLRMAQFEAEQAKVVSEATR